MSSNEKVLKDFETRVRQMLLRFQQLKEENQELYAMIEQNESNIKVLNEKLDQKDRDYNTLKMAKMIEITDKDLEGAKSRLTKLVREVNKCIAILSDAN